MDAADLKVRVADGVRLHVRRWPGRSDNVPFLLVHGLSSNARLWDGVAVRLAALGYPVYAVDLRSHGESDHPATGHDTATAAADLAALATALHLPPAVTAGHSWGADVVLAHAAHHPEQVRAVALVGGWTDLAGQFASWEECERALHPNEMDGLRETDLMAFIRRGHRDWDDWAVRATAANFRCGTDGRLTRRLPVPQHLQILHSMWDDPPNRYYPAVTAPVLLLPAVAADGERAALQRKLIAEAAETLPRATVKEYPRGDHDLHAQHPAAIAADLLELLKRSEDGAGDRQ